MTDIAPALRIDASPYSPRMLRLMADAERTGRRLLHIKGAGFALVTSDYRTTVPHVCFEVAGNRLRLLPWRATHVSQSSHPRP